jgi:hypothetical protein
MCDIINAAEAVGGVYREANTQYVLLHVELVLFFLGA